MRQCPSDGFFDALEIILSAFDGACRSWDHRNLARTQDPDAGLNEINQRLKQHALGYQFVSGELIRLDEEFMHEEVVLPALSLLQLSHFAGTREEFLKAHKHYREGNKSETLVECYKSFESMMKSICEKRRWTYDKTKSASHLIDVCMKENLIPGFWQAHFTGLRTILENAIPAPRNKTSAHGAGTNPKKIPDELVPYVLHMTAATLLFLGEAEARLP